MKAGILTFHRANNYGAVLQAAALQKYISDNICECEIINFMPNNAVPPKATIIHKILHYVKSGIFLKQTIMSNASAKKFDDFRKKYMRISENVYWGDINIDNANLDYDLLISGSDQIFNTTLTGNSHAYYLNFTNKIPKISYASSFGRDDITEEEKNLIKNELPKFRAVSCREGSGVSIIKNLCGINPELVVDPVFLLNRHRWENMVSVKKINKKYILTYLMEENAEINKLSKDLSQKTGLPVYVIIGGKTKNYFGKKLTGLGPNDFLSTIKNAEYVITNSFHGTAFSIIFGKKFYCFAHSKRNARLENIMNLIGQKDKLINVYLGDCTHTDGSSAYNEIMPFIDFSKEFLEKNIKGSVNE